MTVALFNLMQGRSITIEPGDLKFSLVAHARDIGLDLTLGKITRDALIAFARNIFRECDAEQLVIIEVGGAAGGGNAVATHQDAGVQIRIVDWDNLESEGIECPECGGHDLEAATTPESRFVCQNDICGAIFEWPDNN
jgi:hypothetical protein